MGELEILERAHRLLAPGPTVRLAGEAEHFDRALHRLAQTNAGAGHDGYQRAADASRAVMRRAADTDGELAAVLEGAGGSTRRGKRCVRAFCNKPATTPPGRHRLRWRIRKRCGAAPTDCAPTRRHLDRPAPRPAPRRAVLRLLRYRAEQRRVGRRRAAPPSGRAAAAVRAPRCRAGPPVRMRGRRAPEPVRLFGPGAVGLPPGRHPLHRTTYDQIHDGIAVPRLQIQPGDLVFPHTGHVQMAIGNGMVVEARTRARTCGSVGSVTSSRSGDRSDEVIRVNCSDLVVPVRSGHGGGGRPDDRRRGGAPELGDRTRHRAVRRRPPIGGGGGAGAHAVAVTALERLNSIQAEIDTAVAVPAAFAMDTPAGALGSSASCCPNSTRSSRWSPGPPTKPRRKPRRCNSFWTHRTPHA